jgi:hypothetical protein
MEIWRYAGDDLVRGLVAIPPFRQQLRLAAGRARPGACPSVPRSLGICASAAAGVDDLKREVSWFALRRRNETLPFVAGRGGSGPLA